MSTSWTWKRVGSLRRHRVSALRQVINFSNFSHFLHLWRLSKTGPVHLRTSPLENLLIEHPSMSVYQRTGSRHPLLRSPTPSVGHVDDADTEVVMDSSVLGADVEPVVIYRLSRNNSSQRVTSVAQLKEMQMVRHRQAQKVSILTWIKLDWW